MNGSVLLSEWDGVETKSNYVTQADLVLNMQPRLVLNSPSSSCLSLRVLGLQWA